MTGLVRLTLRFRLLGRYWHTLRHLRPVQFYGRLWFRLYRPRPARPDRLSLAARNPGWTEGPSPFPLLRPVSMLGPARFRFLSQTRDVIGPEAWNDPARDKLWLYNLHYFDDLYAADAPARADWHRALVQRWISENPPGQGNGWEPYPTSLRIVNWVKWLLREGEGGTAFFECLQPRHPSPLAEPAARTSPARQPPLRGSRCIGARGSWAKIAW